MNFRRQVQLMLQAARWIQQLPEVPHTSWMFTLTNEDGRDEVDPMFASLTVMVGALDVPKALDRLGGRDKFEDLMPDGAHMWTRVVDGLEITVEVE